MDNFDYYRLNHKRKWLDNIKNKKYGYLYVVKLYNNNECFIKIGITTTSIRRRFNSNFPYKVNIVFVRKHRNLKNLYDKETYLLKKFYNSKHIPKISFIGETECFKMIEIKNIIKEAKKSWKKLKQIDFR